MIKVVHWTRNINDHLKISAGDDLQLIRHQVIMGIAQLWHYDLSDTAKGYLVTRIDVEGKGRELVIVLGEGSGLHEIVPYFVKVARDKGLIGVRVHVKRRGLIRMFQRHGFSVDHFVLRTDNNGQLIKNRQHEFNHG